ncbi:alpha/beta hydrolase [Massilia sp. CCM 8733]|uniref:Alpha/beta hydrolase n=1 Tax=Massilia mucilaginosa TaxID=2609282 RepID=A0ABX0NT10_9BURK|nr:alpha/beta hydrolase [Massilia mucilaginosa]NHZ89893.1 alpha/beta hydrolase [Massilia mucilaginosa]
MRNRLHYNVKHGLSAAVFATMLAACVSQPVVDAGPASPAPAPAPAPAIEVFPPSVPVPAAPPPQPTRERVGFGRTILFPANGTRLQPAQKAELAKQLNELVATDAEMFVVVGHASSTGGKKHAQRISDDRSQEVKRYLESRGIPTARIYTEGKGNNQPVAGNGTADGRALNDRVEIEVVATMDASKANWKPNSIVPVLYATNRARTGSDNPFRFYANRIADNRGANGLERGIALVRIPPERQRGQISRPSWITVTIKRMTDKLGIDELVSFAEPNYKTDFMFEQEIVVLDSADFNVALKDAVGKSSSKTAVLYVHGYNNDFTDAAFRTAQIAYDLSTHDYDIVPLMFAWPSDPGLLLLDYDEAGHRSKISGVALADYLSEIAKTTDIGTVHIVAHSMGSRVLGHALSKLGAADISVSMDGLKRPRFKQIVFAAADIDPDLFAQLIEPAIKSNHNVTSYISTTDIVLWASKIKARLTSPSGISFTRLLKCVDTVDVSSASDRFAHSTWAEAPRVINDLQALLRYGVIPAKRGLREHRKSAWPYWQIPRSVSYAAPLIDADPKYMLTPCVASPSADPRAFAPATDLMTPHRSRLFGENRPTPLFHASTEFSTDF